MEKECTKCQTLNIPSANFCRKCGMPFAFEAKASEKSAMQKTTGFYFFLLAFIVAINFIEQEGYIYQLIIDCLFAAITLVYFFLERKELARLFCFQYVRPSRLVSVILFGGIFAFAISFLSDLINSTFFESEQVRYIDTYSDAPYPLLFALISIGLFPALFEEIGFRGVVMHHMTKLSTPKFSILISAILFTLLHINFISFLWIFPLGLLFGYLRARYRTLWYGILLHFVYNSTIVLIEYFTV